MKRLASLAAVLLLLAAAHQARAADPALERPILAFATAFNAGDLKAAEALFTANPVISDELAPHLWTGAGAVRAWHAALMKDMADHGDTEVTLTVRPATRDVVSGKAAYLIAPATLAFRAKGKTMREEGQIILVLAKAASGWKIATWTWSSAP